MLKMMNVLSLSLVLISLVTAGVWSPTPDKPNPNQRDVIVKEGHRVVVVEYEKEGDAKTKVFISPQEASPVKDTFHAAQEKLSDSATAVKGVAEDAEAKARDGLSGPSERMCDAFGKCKHKIATVLGKTKDKVSQKAHEVSDEVHEVEGHAKEAVGEAKDKVSEKAHQMFDEMTVSDALGKAKERVGNGMGDASSKAQEVSGEAKHVVGEAVGKVSVPEKAKEMVKDTGANMKNWDAVKRIGENIERNVSGKIEDIKENIKEQSKEKEKQAKEAVENAVKEGKKNLKDIIRNGRELINDIIWYIVSPERIEPFMGVVHLLGFSVAYGMCVWVTFVSSYVLSRALPRQQFGIVQSKIYPVYFKAMGYCVGVTLLGHLFTQRKKVSSSMLEMFQGCNLFVSLLMLMTNMVCLEPRASKVMFERMKIEKEEGRGVGGTSKSGATEDDHETVSVSRPTTAAATTSSAAAGEREDIVRLNEKLKMLNTLSSLLNVTTLVVLTWHMVYMGQRLHVTR